MILDIKLILIWDKPISLCIALVRIYFFSVYSYIGVWWTIDICSFMYVDIGLLFSAFIINKT